MLNYLDGLVYVINEYVRNHAVIGEYIEVFLQVIPLHLKKKKNNFFRHINLIIWNKYV
jgi:hypothetical protein